MFPLKGEHHCYWQRSNILLLLRLFDSVFSTNQKATKNRTCNLSEFDPVSAFRTYKLRDWTDWSGKKKTHMKM